MPLIEFSYNNSYYSSIGMAHFEALYGRRSRSPVGWFGVGESSILVLEIIDEAMEKMKMIRDRFATAYSRKKSNGDNRKRDLEFEVGYQVYLNISPMKGVMIFGKKGKLSLKYIALYDIVQRVAHVAYVLKLPNYLAYVHPLFHALMLKKYLRDPKFILPIKGLGVDEYLSYEEVPVEIYDRHVKRLRNKEVATVKVLWRNHLVKGATWEARDDMRSCYPHLLSS